MIGTGLKSLIGWSPVILATIGSAVETLDLGILEKGAGYVAAVIFSYLWHKGESSKKLAWAEVERVRAERDALRKENAGIIAQCRDCPGNAARFNQQNKTP